MSSILKSIEVAIPLLVTVYILFWSLIRIRQQSKLIPNAKLNQKLIVVHLVILFITVVGEVLLMVFPTEEKDGKSDNMQFLMH